MYCPNCNVLIKGEHCPVCGNQNLREPRADDYCFLTEKELIWACVLEDILKQNDISYVTRNVLGAGLTTKVGSAQERIRFYVTFIHYAAAHNLEQDYFSANMDIMQLE